MAGVAGFKLQYGEEYYRIVGPGGEEGEPTEVGSPAYLEIGGQMYTAFLDVDPDAKEGECPEPESQIEPVPAVVYLLGAAQVTEYEEADFEGDEEDEEDEEDEHEDEEDEHEDEESDVVEVEDEENKGD